MWNMMDIQVNLIKIDFHFLHVQSERGMELWLLTVVYASLHGHEHVEHWRLCASHIIDFMMGDFNEIFSP